MPLHIRHLACGSAPDPTQGRLLELPSALWGACMDPQRDHDGRSDGAKVEKSGAQRIHECRWRSETHERLNPLYDVGRRQMRYLRVANEEENRLDTVADAGDRFFT